VVRVGSQNKKRGDGTGRDNFPVKVIQRLRQRVNDRCSAPDCRVPTSAPGDGEMDVSCIGIASHIHAASRGGPRFLESLTREQRISIQNGIWLCSGCSVKVDRKPEEFTADLLRAWKRQAEQRSAAEHGKRLPEPEDAFAQASMILSAAPDRFLRSAMANTAKATALALERLDDRFTIDAAFANGVSQYTLNVKEEVREVPFSVEVPADSAQPWIDGLQSLQDHAREARLPMKDASFAGSALLGKLMTGMDGGGHLVIAPHGRRASVHITTIPDTPDAWTFDEIRGAIFVGQKTARFEGTACNDILQLQLTLPNTYEPQSSCSVTFGTDFQAWEGRPVTGLPFAERLLRFAEQLMVEAPLKLEIDIDGKRIPAIGRPRFPHGQEAFGQLTGFLHYANLAANLSKWLSIPLAFRAGPISRTAFEHLAQVVVWIRGEQFEAADLREDPLAKMNRDAAEALCKQEWGVARLELPSIPVNVYGSEVQLPNLIVHLEDVRARIVQGEDTSGYVEVVFERGAEFKLVRGLHRVPSQELDQQH
jgi:hypothetical protein